MFVESVSITLSLFDFVLCIENPLTKLMIESVPPPPDNRIRDEKEAIRIDSDEIQKSIIIYL